MCWDRILEQELRLSIPQTQESPARRLDRLPAESPTMAEEPLSAPPADEAEPVVAPA